MQIILRFGALGDTVTAISLAESENLDLVYSSGYRDFLFHNFRRNNKHNHEPIIPNLLSRKGKGHITYVDIVKLRSLVKVKGYDEIMIFVQTVTLPMKIIKKIISSYCAIKVSFIDETVQWLIPLRHQLTSNFIESMPVVFKKKDPVIVIAWDGKESSKSLNAPTIESICEYVFSTNKLSTVKVVGKFRIQLDNIGPRVVNLSGKTSIVEMINQVKSADLFIGCDSGPLHAANFFNIPILSIISARIPRGKWMVVGKNTTFVTDFFIPCRYCESVVCPKDVNYCVNGEVISKQLEYIFSSIQSLMKK